MVGELNKLPTSLEPIGELGDKQLPVVVSAVWFKFFTSVSQLMDSLVGGVLGFSTDTAVTGAGAAQGDAAVLDTEWAVVTVTPPGSGVMINSFGPGVASTVFNRGANALNVYPPVGGSIDALAINAPYPLPASKMQVFSQIGPAQWASMQLG